MDGQQFGVDPVIKPDAAAPNLHQPQAGDGFQQGQPMALHMETDTSGRQWQDTGFANHADAQPLPHNEAGQWQETGFSRPAIGQQHNGVFMPGTAQQTSGPPAEQPGFVGTGVQGAPYNGLGDHQVPGALVQQFEHQPINLVGVQALGHEVSQDAQGVQAGLPSHGYVPGVEMQVTQYPESSEHIVRNDNTVVSEPPQGVVGSFIEQNDSQPQYVHVSDPAAAVQQVSMSSVQMQAGDQQGFPAQAAALAEQFPASVPVVGTAAVASEVPGVSSTANGQLLAAHGTVLNSESAADQYAQEHLANPTKQQISSPPKESTLEANVAIDPCSVHSTAGQGQFAHSSAQVSHVSANPVESPKDLDAAHHASDSAATGTVHQDNGSAATSDLERLPQSAEPQGDEGLVQPLKDTSEGPQPSQAHVADPNLMTSAASNEVDSTSYNDKAIESNDNSSATIDGASQSNEQAMPSAQSAEVVDVNSTIAVNMGVHEQQSASSAQPNEESTSISISAPQKACPEAASSADSSAPVCSDVDTNVSAPTSELNSDSQKNHSETAAADLAEGAGIQEPKASANEVGAAEQVSGVPFIADTQSNNDSASSHSSHPGDDNGEGPAAKDGSQQKPGSDSQPQAEDGKLSTSAVVGITPTLENSPTKPAAGPEQVKPSIEAAPDTTAAQQKPAVVSAPNVNVANLSLPNVAGIPANIPGMWPQLGMPHAAANPLLMQYSTLLSNPQLLNALQPQLGQMQAGMSVSGAPSLPLQMPVPPSSTPSSSGATELPITSVSTPQKASPSSIIQPAPALPERSQHTGDITQADAAAASQVWSQEEHEQFLKCIEQNQPPYNFEEIQKAIPSRTLSQVINHASMYFTVLGKRVNDPMSSGKGGSSETPQSRMSVIQMYNEFVKVTKDINESRMQTLIPGVGSWPSMMANGMGGPFPTQGMPMNPMLSGEGSATLWPFPSGFVQPDGSDSGAKGGSGSGLPTPKADRSGPSKASKKSRTDTPGNSTPTPGSVGNPAKFVGATGTGNEGRPDSATKAGSKRKIQQTKASTAKRPKATTPGSSNSAKLATPVGISRAQQLTPSTLVGHPVDVQKLEADVRQERERVKVGGCAAGPTQWEWVRKRNMQPRSYTFLFPIFKELMPLKKKEIMTDLKAMQLIEDGKRGSALSTASSSAASSSNNAKAKQKSEKASASAQESGLFWVACDQCGEWRTLFGLSSQEQAQLQKSKWFCFMHPDKKSQKCVTKKKKGKAK